MKVKEIYKCNCKRGIIKCIRFSIKKEEIFRFRDKPNIIRMLVGLLAPNSGSIVIGGDFLEKTIGNMFCLLSHTYMEI